MKRNQSGFTLIEIAIVLVIIGLLLGGVLKGQELITQAKIKNVLKDFDAISVAVLGYQDRYKKLPGDDNLAPSRWAAPTGLTPTPNANGTIDAAEAGLFWAHLRLAGFVSGDTSNASEVIAAPLNAVGGSLSVSSVTGLSGSSLCSSQLNGKIAGAVDNQFDDGKATSGNMRGFPSTGTADAAYADDANTLYTICRSL
ncbi:MAG: prepilin-type N-terminal cleavage/methylation domain-containing protein [Gallionella sp.]|nr:prepilin-type N-terminal cleavage/methylation domain-containing protein [Gallionella sp.]